MSVTPTELLREHGIQVTAQRLAVLRAVSAQPHISAEDVTIVAGTDIGAISRQAVYDALGVLVAKGLIRRIQPVGSPARYEDRVDDNHHHLICRDCGRLVDVDCAVGAAPCLTASDDNGYEIDEADVAYWGRCPQCQANELTTNGVASRTVDRRSPRRTSLRTEPSPQTRPESDGTHDRH
ncbi:MAG TPA: Fur family transcriptional regulator [Acidimicrobiales bacterium]|nr:Fur family transcriptional regulator [Acidimicrobiales bacterium]